MFKSVVLLFGLIASSAWATPAYVGELTTFYPGSRVSETTKCQTCHNNNGHSMNAFGSDFAWLKSHVRDRADMFKQLGAKDSDGDGLTNLEEIISGTNPGKADTKVALDCPAGCSCMNQGFKITYCVDHSSTSKNKDIVYYLHGAGGEATNWRDPFFYTEQVRQFWQDRGLDRPTVVALSFDLSPLIQDPKAKEQMKNKWVLTEKNGDNPFSGLLPLLTDTLIPKIEGELKAPFARRMVVGESMGGFNSLQLALKSTIFNKAAVICAPISESLTPFSSWESVEAYAKGTIAWNYYSQTPEGVAVIKSRIEGIQQFSRVFAMNEETWSHANVFQLLQTADVRRLPELYLTAGAYDPYLAYEGSARFAELLKEKGGKVEWRPEWGGHCAIDIPSLAEFLTK